MCEGRRGQARVLSVFVVAGSRRAESVCHASPRAAAVHGGSGSGGRLAVGVAVAGGGGEGSAASVGAVGAATAGTG